MHFHLHSQFIRLFFVSAMYMFAADATSTVALVFIPIFVLNLSLSARDAPTQRNLCEKKPATALHDIQRDAFTNSSLSLFHSFNALC